MTEVTPKVPRNCSRLFEGHHSSILETKSQLKKWTNQVSDKELLEKTRNCSWVRGYFTDNLYTTNLEISFPLAFSFVVYDSPQQILRLLRFLYRQHNSYCIHPDKESTNDFINIFKNLAACLDNIIIPKKLIRVVWGKASVLEAGMSCLKELVKFRKNKTESKKWKYVINLCGKELPMATNHGIVKHLAKLNGFSNIKSDKVPRSDWDSWQRLGKKTIPFRAKYYKSMAYVALSYKFVDYVLTNSVATKLYEFFRNCLIPDEHYFATLSRIPGVPGGFDSTLTYIDVDSYFWMYHESRSCGGKKVHDICVVSVEELKELLSRSGDGKKSLFHNKYFMELDHIVMDCMEERLVARNRIEFKQDCYM